MTVVSNTSPITSLAGVGQLNLLQQLYGSIIIPPAVYTEMVGAGSLVPGAIEVQTLPWIQTREVVNQELVTELLEELNLGEAQAIVLALELKAELLLLDELPGRTIASQYGLNITGVLGILLEAKRNGSIPAVKPLMDRLIEQVAFRVSSRLYAEVLQSAGE
ncbi:DUF3368 domain-containing protein [Microseira wollei]|uniref:Nucleic acid-binding protein n=1 Tax=Microseira wollei NIES-4236 TaxID=2530354 RepID=A0AAV3XKB1_9CYAN|nr:DUF3368 domain-containing protein [Microseira wollei]GET43103.1 hypothetical protein MiSe_79240 [Microseira wollei NIES-4236]